MQPLLEHVPPEPATAPVLFMPGSQDPTVGPAVTESYATLLRQRGFQLTRRDVPASHNLTEADIAAASAWLQSLYAQPERA